MPVLRHELRCHQPTGLLRLDISLDFLDNDLDNAPASLATVSERDRVMRREARGP
jgi:hypothetical protein